MTPEVRAMVHEHYMLQVADKLHIIKELKAGRAEALIETLEGELTTEL